MASIVQSGCVFHVQAGKMHLGQQLDRQFSSLRSEISGGKCWFHRILSCEHVKGRWVRSDLAPQTDLRWCIIWRRSTWYIRPCLSCASRTAIANAVRQAQGTHDNGKVHNFRKCSVVAKVYRAYNTVGCLLSLLPGKICEENWLITLACKSCTGWGRAKCKFGSFKTSSHIWNQIPPTLYILCYKG